jgi:hypothetical protein
VPSHQEGKPDSIKNQAFFSLLYIYKPKTKVSTARFIICTHSSF